MAEIDNEPTASANQPSKAGTPPPAAPLRTFVIVGMVVGVLALGVVPVMCLGAAWLFSGSDTTADQKKDPSTEVAAQPIDEPALPVEAPTPLDPLMPPHIQAAIDKGVAHLRKRLDANKLPIKGKAKLAGDRAIGMRALSALALLECKVPIDDPAFQAALESVRDGAPQMTDAYSLSCVLFLLNRLHGVQPLQSSDRDLVRSLALRLVAGQRSTGGWTYVNPVLSPQAEEQLLARLNANDYAPPGKQAGGDNSITQFVLLALWGSMHSDLPLRAPILYSARQFRKSQSDRGTWSYSGVPNGNWQDSSTCAGLIALAMEKTLRSDEKYRGHGGGDGAPVDPKLDEQIAKAFAHLAAVVDRDPQKKGKRLLKTDAHGDFYFLWSLERVAVVYEKKQIGAKDWYEWGSDILVNGQRPDGSWQDIHGDTADTCFALLFLTRANLAKDLTESIRTRGGKQIVVP